MFISHMTNKKTTNSEDLFFKDNSQKTIKKEEAQEKTQILLSTDTLSGYGLDLIFQLTKEAGFDGIDLATRKNFDARNINYVKKLSAKHELPIKIVQVSSSINEKEINKALDLCYETKADTISINPPKIFNMKSYNFLLDNLPRLRKENKNIRFSIINPENSNIFALPIPKYRFTNIVEIIKKYSCYLWLDISNMDTSEFEDNFMRKLREFLPYISTIYFSDKTRLGYWHTLPGEWILKLENFLKRLKEYNYRRHISIKLELSKSDLADAERVLMILKKARKYMQENFDEVELD